MAHDAQEKVLEATQTKESKEPQGTYQEQIL